MARATANYADSGCGQADTIIVSASGAPSVQGTLTIQPAAATNLVFVSANPDVMGIQGSGANSSSLVTFKAVDASQQPVANVSVKLTLLSTLGGGVGLDAFNGAADSDQDDSCGWHSVHPGGCRHPTGSGSGAGGGWNELVCTLQQPDDSERSADPGTLLNFR